MTFYEAFHAERKAWNWSKMPGGSESVLMAFCWCLNLRMQGLDPDKFLAPRQRSKKKGRTHAQNAS